MSLFSFVDQVLMMSLNAYRAGRGRQLHKRSPEFWQDLPTRVLNEASCAFTLSTGRCGTRFLTKVLRHCGNVDVNHHAELANELQFPSRRIYEAAMRGEAGLDMAAMSCRYEPIQTSFLNGRNYVETNNRITFFAPHLHKVFKKARFLHLVRNPASFVRSGVNANFYSGGYYDTGRITPISNAMRSDWKEYSQVKKTAWLWNATNEFIEKFKESVEPECIMTVRAEDLFKQTDLVSTVIDFLGGKAISEKKIKQLISKPINAGLTGGLPSSYKNWPKQNQDDLRLECTLAERYGYNFNSSVSKTRTYSDVA